MCILICHSSTFNHTAIHICCALLFPPLSLSHTLLLSPRPLSRFLFFCFSLSLFSTIFSIQFICALQFNKWIKSHVNFNWKCMASDKFQKISLFMQITLKRTNSLTTVWKATMGLEDNQKNRQYMEKLYVCYAVR